MEIPTERPAVAAVAARRGPGATRDPVAADGARSRWRFRVPMTLAATLLFGQALLAGQFLSGAYGALDVHRANAFLAEVMVVISAVGAFIDSRARSAPRWPPLVCAGLAVAVGVQIGMGLNRELAVHIPLGVAIIATAALLVQESWKAAS